MPLYGNKSHEELRHEDYQIRDKGVRSSPPSIWQPSTELQPQGPYYSSKPFWLPLRDFSQQFHLGHLQSSKQGPCASTSSLSFSFPVRSMGVQTSPFCPVSPDQPQTEFQKNQSSYSPSSFAIPCTARGSILSGTETHTASATKSSPKSKATFWPNFSISTLPTAHQENVFSNSVAACTTVAETISTRPSNQKISTISTRSRTISSAAHSEPSPDAHCTSVNVDYPHNTVELLLPADISLVKIRFSSQVHSDDAARASETPISQLIYPGQNEELIIQSIERPPKSQTGKQSSSIAGSCPNGQNDKDRNSAAYPPLPGSISLRNRSSSDVHLTQKSITAPACEGIAGSVLPRLYNASYYTIPSIVELAVRESNEPGYCARVPDFIVGRYGYGSVKFDGETDVRRLDITSILEFNDREILVYRDERKAPDLGQELNKPAEVTLLNVKCIDRKTGLQLTEGPPVDRYKEVLVQWTKEHDAEFVSFNAVRGEWKFRVKNFRQ